MGREEGRYRILVSHISLFLLLFQGCIAANNNITRSNPLLQEQVLTSSGQSFELGFFQPNNSVHKYVGIWYKDITPRRYVWVANRQNPVTDSLTSLTIGRDGNLQLLDGSNQVTLWSTNVSISSNINTIAELLDNGNFALKDGLTGQNLWQSFDHPSDTLLLGGSLGFNSKTGERRVLTSWRSENDPSPGSFVLGLNPDQSPPQAYVWKGSVPYWRSGLWDKTTFIGIPDMDSSYSSVFEIKTDNEQGTVYFYANPHNQSVFKNIFMSSVGYLQALVGEGGDSLTINWEVPTNPCDIYGTCGPFGVCKASESPICSCLKGFEPYSDEEWSKGNWTRGCVRRNELLCEANPNSSATKNRGNVDDGFWKMDRMKLPDYSEIVDIDSSQCQQWCLNNCSCMAYAVVYGIGCLVWRGNLTDMQEFSFGGQEFFLRLTLSRASNKTPKEKLIISLTSIFGMIILGMLAYGIYRQRCCRIGKHKRISKDFQVESDASSEILPGYTLRSHLRLEDPSELPMFDLDTILVATDNFSIRNKLGQGGFGPVYRGQLHDEKLVAVKRLSSSSGQGLEEFKNEVMLISKLQHRNLVRLFGYCIEKEERILVYEFMANKSLDTFLFDPRKKSELNWARRFNIIQGVARGLLYLHRDSCLRVIHRDLKVSNILLDDKMNPKISDFGLARIFQGTQHLANTHKVVGTLGYMSPEYALGGIFSEKSDVFSFGVLVLEIVNGRKVTTSYSADQYISLVNYAWQMWNQSKEVEFVDEALAKDSISSSQVKRCIHVGLLCVQDHAENRPTMPQVVFMLSSESETDQLPKPKQPAFTFQNALNSAAPDSNSDRIWSINEITESVLVAR